MIGLSKASCPVILELAQSISTSSKMTGVKTIFMLLPFIYSISIVLPVIPAFKSFILSSAVSNIPPFFIVISYMNNDSSLSFFSLTAIQRKRGFVGYYELWETFQPLNAFLIHNVINAVIYGIDNNINFQSRLHTPSIWFFFSSKINNHVRAPP